MSALLIAAAYLLGIAVAGAFCEWVEMDDGFRPLVVMFWPILAVGMLAVAPIRGLALLGESSVRWLRARRSATPTPKDTP